MRTEPTLKSTLLADLAVNWSNRGNQTTPSSWGDVLRSMGDVRFLPVAMIRLGRTLVVSGGFRRVLGKFIFLAARIAFGVEVAAQTMIGPGLYFPHTGGIVIGAARLGARCVVYQGTTLGAKTIDMAFTTDLRPHIGDDVVIAAGAKVLGGVFVGDGAVIGANAVVVHDVEPGDVVGGIPAVPLRRPSP